MDAASYFHRERVQPTLGLAHAAPAAGPLRLAGPRGARARPAPDAGEPLVEQRVVGDLFLADVAPHVLTRPAREREDLHDGVAVHLMVFEHVHRGSGFALVAPHRADPSIEAGESALQRLDLTDPAAAVGIGLVQRARIRRRV